MNASMFSVKQSACLPTYPPVCLSVCKYIHTSIHPSIHTHTDIHTYTYGLKCMDRSACILYKQKHYEMHSFTCLLSLSIAQTHNFHDGIPDSVRRCCTDCDGAFFPNRNVILDILVIGERVCPLWPTYHKWWMQANVCYKIIYTSIASEIKTKRRYKEKEKSMDKKKRTKKLQTYKPPHKHTHIYIQPYIHTYIQQTYVFDFEGTAVQKLHACSNLGSCCRAPAMYCNCTQQNGLKERIFGAQVSRLDVRQGRVHYRTFEMVRSREKVLIDFVDFPFLSVSLSLSLTCTIRV